MDEDAQWRETDHRWGTMGGGSRRNDRTAVLPAADTLGCIWPAPASRSAARGRKPRVNILSENDSDAPPRSFCDCLYANRRLNQLQA